MPSFRSLSALLSGGGLLLSAAAVAAPPPARPAAKPAAKPAPAARKPVPQPARPAANANSPEQVLRAFFQAQENGDDEKAYSFLSSAAKERFPATKWEDQGRNVRLTFTAINLLVGDSLLVGGAEHAKNNVAPASVSGDTATLKVTHLVPIENTVRMVRENGQWKIDLHRSLSVDPGATAAKPTPPATPPKPATPPPPPDTTPFCQGNLRQLGNAFRVFALDHEGRLPEASNWTDQLQPYLQSASVLKCSPDSMDESDFAMNAALSNAKLSEVENPGRRVLLYESTTSERNVSGAGTTLPAAAPRPKGYLVLYADGTVGFSPARPVVN